MIPRSLVSVAYVLLLGGLAPWPAAAQAPPDEDVEQRFDGLLAAAKRDPEKADWVRLRRSFAETKRYRPYHREWKEELVKIGVALDGEDPKAAEAALDKLMEREGCMRIDAHALAASHYAKTGQEEKNAFHTRCVEGIAGTLFVPGTGKSFEKPIEVLFIEEEYLFLGSLELKAERQGLAVHEGRRFDVFEIEAKGGGGPVKYYFNVDLPWKSLGKTFRPEAKGEVD
ncbi:hypothetical protein [Paludisphaera mucosa]|uniref:Uncharacterized protein n=1 Tax=Paludisphaera mucosa TaxID=3030827 RepID=A0ABT6FKB2_9BACT|nr:hypothetical protein [Paludisphaera mucosa]MDG3007825.1 hypothetical protein [Paludisphaera mucosa]